MTTKEVNVADVLAEAKAIEPRGQMDHDIWVGEMKASHADLITALEQLQGTNKDLSDFLVSKNEYLGELEAKLKAAEIRVAELEEQLGKYELTSDEAHRLQAEQERLEAENKALSGKDGD